MNILFISRWFPYPTSNGSKLRIYNLLRGLSEHHVVSLLSFVEDEVDESARREMCSICETVQTVPWKGFVPNSRRAQLGFLQSTPRSLVDTFSPQMARQIKETLCAKDYDLVIASQLAMAAYAPAFAGKAALFEEVELGVYYEQYARADSLPERLRYGLTWQKHRRYLARLLSHFAACTVASEQERRLLQQAASGYTDVHVIPNCVDLASYTVRPTKQPNQLVFTGSFRYAANHDAMCWFVQEIYPAVQSDVPNVALKITGDHADLPLPPADNVTLTGFVDDIQSLIAESAISIVPLRVGGGTRLKVLEAMALGTPVVSTSKGVEGVAVQDGVHVLIADTPADFAAAVVRLLCDAKLRQRLAHNARELVKKRYDWSGALPDFLEIVERTAHTNSARTQRQFTRSIL